MALLVGQNTILNVPAYSGGKGRPRAAKIFEIANTSNGLTKVQTSLMERYRDAWWELLAGKK